MWDVVKKGFHINYLELKQLNALARDIWLWCEERNLWLSVFHIAGVRNIRADQLSRAGEKLIQDMEWALDPNIFHEIQKKTGICRIDLFASAKITNYLFTVLLYHTTRLWQ